MPFPEVVITGLGVVSSLGIGRDSFIEGMKRGAAATRSLSHREDDGAVPSDDQRSNAFWIGAPVTGFDAKQFVKPRKALKVMCREIQTAFAASEMAIDDAGLREQLPASEASMVRPNRLGTVLGSEMFYGPPDEMVRTLENCRDESGQINPAAFGAAAMKGIMPLWMLKYLPNMPACHIGIAINAQGPNNSLVLGDVGALAAMSESVDCIRRGIADLMFSGGTGTRINTTRMNYRLDYPVAISDEVRQNVPAPRGVIGGEGSGIVILELEEHARKRGRKPIARWLASASRYVASESMRTGAKSNDLSPTGRGSSRAVSNAIEAAIQKAGLAPGQVDFVVGHAMGDPSMDIAGNDGVKRVLGNVPEYSPVTWMGHAGAASGALAVVAAVTLLESPHVARELPWKEDTPPNLIPSGAVGLVLTHTSEGSAHAVLLTNRGVA